MAHEPIPLPDGTSVSRAEGFASWLAMNDYLVDEDFLVFDVDGMPDDPFSAAGLKVAEAEALRRFADIADALAPDNRELFDKFVRFAGSAFVKGLGGSWTNQPLIDDGKAFIGVSFPWAGSRLNVTTLVTAAIARRTGEEWAFVWGFQQNRRDTFSG